MTTNRTPGSREEDAWLSDEQLRACAPAEEEPFQGPVPTRMISNGEYMPVPQTEHLPLAAGRPGLISTCSTSFISRFSLHLTQ